MNKDTIKQALEAGFVRWDYQNKDGQRLAVYDTEAVMTAFLAALEAEQPASDAQPEADHHFDDHAVDCFAKMMKKKLRYSREVKGRDGWDDPEQCSVEYLNALLLEHVAKGDPVDVANLCMMLTHYQAKIAVQPESFDTWINNPYTKSLQKSIDEDYVSKRTATPSASAAVLPQAEQPVAQKWAVYYKGDGKYDAGFVTNFALYDGQHLAQGVCDANGPALYEPREVYIYAAPVQPASKPEVVGPAPMAFFEHQRAWNICKHIQDETRASLIDRIEAVINARDEQWREALTRCATSSNTDVVEDLRMLVGKLVRALLKAAPDHAFPAKAMDYLQRKGLQGSPLRDTSGKEASDAAQEPKLSDDIKELARKHAAWLSKGPQFGAHFYEASLMNFVNACSAAQAAQPCRDDVIEDLRLLVVRLVRQLEKVDPGKDLGPQALDYLRRKGLGGSPLRTQPAQQATAAEAGKEGGQIEIDKLKRISKWMNNLPIPTTGATAMMILLHEVLDAISPTVPESASVPVQAVTLTDEEIRNISRSLPSQPWGIGSRMADAVVFARAIERRLLAGSAKTVETIPCCGDPDCNACDKVPVARAVRGDRQ